MFKCIAHWNRDTYTKPFHLYSIIICYSTNSHAQVLTLPLNGGSDMDMDGLMNGPKKPVHSEVNYFCSIGSKQDFMFNRYDSFFQWL